MFMHHFFYGHSGGDRSSQTFKEVGVSKGEVGQTQASHTNFSFFSKTPNLSYFYTTESFILFVYKSPLI